MLPIEYIEKQEAPELESCLEHDDWVSGIHVADTFVLTGKNIQRCYSYYCFYICLK